MNTQRTALMKEATMKSPECAKFRRSVMMSFMYLVLVGFIVVFGSSVRAVAQSHDGAGEHAATMSQERAGVAKFGLIGADSSL